MNEVQKGLILQSTYKSVTIKLVNQKGFAPLIIVIALGTMAAVFASGYFLGQQHKSVLFIPTPTSSNSTANRMIFNTPYPQPTPPGPICAEYGEVAKSDLYDQYTVKRGDSLLTIAQKQLGDSSRIGEIVNLNKDHYPNLTKDSFLEVGWIIFLPPKNTNYTDSLLDGIKGKITNINPTYFMITNSSYGSAEFAMYYSRSDAYINDLPFKVGDCVVVKYSTQGQIPYSITLQAPLENPSQELTPQEESKNQPLPVAK